MNKLTISLILIFIGTILLAILINIKNIIKYFKIKKYFIEFYPMVNRLFDHEIIPLFILLSEKSNYIKRLNKLSYNFIIYIDDKFLLSLDYDIPFRELQIQTIIDILSTEKFSTSIMNDDPELLYDISELLIKLNLYKSASVALSNMYFDKFILFLDDIKEKERNYFVC